MVIQPPLDMFSILCSRCRSSYSRFPFILFLIGQWHCWSLFCLFSRFFYFIVTIYSVSLVIKYRFLYIFMAPGAFSISALLISCEYMLSTVWANLMGVLPEKKEGTNFRLINTLLIWWTKSAHKGVEKRSSCKKIVYLIYTNIFLWGILLVK